ncbi:polyprotein [Setosphaeria turcica hypovirus 1]|uniref:Polyprotein n=1 Tax=Setosphaeria turcica hypovirus 1 TaxID=2501272 RepID=A0ABM7E5Y3_9VIRU|nr:polyprotein [Setosphaeria turcica hypovirus 1]AZT88613.1 polyprotein [Setosphaeria turcica hypovirus 1]
MPATQMTKKTSRLESLQENSHGLEANICTNMGVVKRTQAPDGPSARKLRELEETETLVVRTPRDVNSRAWLGDALLALNIRKMCLDFHGSISERWCQVFTSNAAQAVYMRRFHPDTLSGVSSDHSLGQRFEACYADDPAFHKGFNDWARSKLTAPLGEGYCWKKLFKDVSHPWLRTLGPWVSGYQLHALIAFGLEPTKKTFGWTEHNGVLHISNGCGRFSDFLTQLSVSAIIGGDAASWEILPVGFSEVPSGKLCPGDCTGSNTGCESCLFVSRSSVISTGAAIRSRRNSNPVFPRYGFGNDGPARFDRRKFTGDKEPLRVGTGSQTNHRRVASMPVLGDSRQLARWLEINERTYDEDYWVELGKKLEAEHRSFIPLVPTTREGGVNLDGSTMVGGNSNCWQCLFKYDLGEDVTVPLEMLKIALEPVEGKCNCGGMCGDSDVLWRIQLNVSWNGEVLHFENPTFHGKPHHFADCPCMTCQAGGTPNPHSEGPFFPREEGKLWMKEVLDAIDPSTNVGLTTAVVLGTIGDVEPTLDVVSANHFAAETANVSATEWEADFELEVTGCGWCASDFLTVCPSFARAMDDKHGAQKGRLKVSGYLWNEICSVWSGEPLILVGGPQAGYAPGAFPEDVGSHIFEVPVRPEGPHERIFPADFTLVTHPDHIAKLAVSHPEVMACIETRPIDIGSHEFIKLGQDILEGGFGAIPNIKAMQRHLIDALKVTLPIIEQSDLVYLVSGTTFHYFIGSLFPDKQVFEVCPVPRENNGVCPEFYLGHYSEMFSADPSFGHAVGRWHNQWCMAPACLKELDWSGEFSYREPPKFHSIMPWAREKWHIESPNIGFKPYDDFVIKRVYDVGAEIEAYFSLGSCETITKETQVVVNWLRSLPVRWHVDPRWLHLFVGTSASDSGYFNHATGLARYDWVVHHGGSGVTNTCLAVGVPHTILPQIGDQFVWAKALKDTLVPTLVGVEEVRSWLTDPSLSISRPSCGLSMGGTGVRSSRRYLQVDSRMLARAPNYRVGRALLDRITDWEDIPNIEAYWSYTNSWPPHYRPTSNYEEIIEEVSAMYSNVIMRGIMEDVCTALGNVLSVSSPSSIARRIIGVNVLTPVGRGVMRNKWHVMVDALRHYGDFARDLGLEVIPPLVREYFTVLPHVECTSVVHYKGLIHTPIRSKIEACRWMDTMRANGSKLLVHFFALKLPALGPTFGVFHAVVEFNGKFYELQQLAGERTWINETRWQPEPSPDRPLVKTIVVSSEVVGALDMRRIHREFSNNDYKVLGDNCLMFANFLVFQLTGKVIPWRHFGAFGQDINLEIGTNLRKWAVSYVWTDQQEVRCSIDTVQFSLMQLWGKAQPLAKVPHWQGPQPLVKDYGLQAIRTVERVIQEYDRMEPTDTPWSESGLLSLADFGYKRFGLSSHIVSQALLAFRMKNIPQRRRTINLYTALCSTLRKFSTSRLAVDVVDVLDASARIQNPLRVGKKPAWAPLVNVSVPRHWFREGEKLVAPAHDPENLNIQFNKVVKLDLPQIAKRYEKYFDGVQFPKMGFKYVSPGEYEIGVKVPMRKNLPKMDDLTLALVKDLQEMHPFEVGIFSLRFGTEKMAEKVTDRYFVGTFEAGQLIPDAKQTELANAIFRNERALYENAQLVNPEEVYRKWHKNYSAGFPFRFNEKGNAKRQALVDACGGKDKFLECVRKYIESPECFPTVSHAFVKDEVLPSSYVEREKIRTIIAQDPLNYFAECAIGFDHAKRQDPTSFSAVGVSPAHGELAALAEKHLAYKHHFAMDVTALDSTAAVDAIDTIKKLRFLGFQSHPQAAQIKTLIDGTYDNLMTSWIIDIHTGRARLKKQGLTTGHALTTPSNTEYMKVMMLYAWGEITGRPYDEFYEAVKFSSFSDDNFWSTSLPKSVFSAQLISDFWLKRGVTVRVEGESDNLADLSFLAKRFSFDPVHLEEVRRYAKRDAKVAIVHDVDRLLQKFSDFKSKNTLGYRWEKLVALQSNCAHHKDIFDKVSEYLDALEKTMTRRQFMRKFMRQHPRKTYEEVMTMMYSPKNNKSGLIVSSVDTPLSHSLINWWDKIRVDIMTFDSTVNSYGRVLQTLTGLLEIGGLNVEDPGVYLRATGELPKDKNFTLEHHVWLLNGCPGTFEQFRNLVQKTPFSAFCRAEEFWSIRDRFDVSEECANGLRAKLFMLQAIYTVIAWLEKSLNSVPVLGPMYRVFCSAKGLSEQAYSRLNAMYYAMFGDSSIVLSSMMPKDRYFTLKVAAFKLWTHVVGTDLYDFAGDLDQFRGIADAAAKLSQDIQSLVFEMDISTLVPRPDNPENGNVGHENGWSALDHSHSVNECKDLLLDGKEPLVTGPTGCGKSTDFIVSLSKVYNTVLVSCPRRVLVKDNPVAQKRLYAGSNDKLVPGLINFGTAGYFRMVLGELPDDTILVLDEFHELDEDTLWLKERFNQKVICVSATPKFQNSGRFTPVVLTKSRNSGHTVDVEITNTKGDIYAVWDKLNQDERPGDKTLCILPSVHMVHELTRHAVKLASTKRVCELYRGHDEVTDADWYFATSIVDAGLTIPHLTRVIDTGWSSGWSSGSFKRRPSSHNTMDQRKGRTGRMCDGRYHRLISSFCDEPWDFTTPFMFNHWEVVKQWAPHLKRPIDNRKACLGSLPVGYEELFGARNWSAIIYLVFYYENRGDVDRTRSAYQNARKWPEHPDVQYIVGPHANEVFHDLHVVESRLRSFRIPGHIGNVWTWDGSDTRLENFAQPVPKHLQDRD